MFEDSLMESQNRLSSPNQGWLALVSLAFQSVILAGVIVLPLLHPEVLPFRSNPATLMLPLKPVPPKTPRIELKDRATNSRSSSLATPPQGTQPIHFNHPGPTTTTIDQAPPLGDNLGRMTGPAGIPGGIGDATVSTGRHVTLAAAAGPLHISRGVSAGLLLSPIRPVYPPIAISARVEGVVVVEAIISRDGHIESARATSGPELLRNAALEAIRHARYSPYQLNGSPTEVETTITVNFKLAA